MHNRISRLLGATGLAITLVIGGALATTMAALPNVTTDGTNLSPPFVSNGAIAAFDITATDNDTSTLAQFYLTEANGNSVYQAVPSQGTCTQSGRLECTFGQVKPGETVEVKVAFTTPANGSSATYDFEWSTTGFVTGQNRSHGDSFGWGPVTVSLTKDVNKAGTYVWDSSLLTVHDGTSLGTNNKQSTTVKSPATAIAVAVQDGTIEPCLGLSASCPSSFFGETSQIQVGGGTSYATPFEVVLQLYRPGVNPNQVNGIYHSWTDGSGDHDELITTVCSGSPTPTNAPCYTAKKVGGQNLELDIWLFHNGNVRGW